MRDSNRSAVRTLFLSALSYGLDSVMLVWGDKYGEGEGSSNVYDYPSLSEAIKEMRELADRANVKATILAPVNVATLGTKKGDVIASSRLKSGADCLLAQPPTTGRLRQTFPQHLRILEGRSSGRTSSSTSSRSETRRTSSRAGSGSAGTSPTWRQAWPRRGERRGSSRSRSWSSRRCARDRLPGVYVSTRGKPELARFILD